MRDVILGIAVTLGDELIDELDGGGIGALWTRLLCQVAVDVEVVDLQFGFSICTTFLRFYLMTDQWNDKKNGME